MLKCQQLTFIIMINTPSERFKAKKTFFICRYLNFYQQMKFPGQLSWAWKKIFITSGSGYVSNQLAQLRRLARLLLLCMLQVKLLYLLESEQPSCWSNCADASAQAGLRFCCSHVIKSGFLDSRTNTLYDIYVLINYSVTVLPRGTCMQCPGLL